MKKLLVGLLTALVLAGCSAGQETTDKNKQNITPVAQEQQVEQHVQVTITKENGKEELSNKNIEFKEGQSLIEVMEKNFDLETAYEGTFITGINGVIADESQQYAWMYSINSEEATVGANDYVLKNGDVIQFDLHKW
ncbi:DUF4430 domain-containing protein [Bacillus sp. M6-12]|uniref:DUF4430 domain-containing protein n=1 Tax=Bacillus sp. M6-12 TaxID=2054166 RepID=UPI0015E0DAF9|nr:DUF4430 domain-containing protein [Bacillus sp. M6-12]